MRVIVGEAGQGKRVVSVGLGLALVFMALVSVIDQAAGEEVVKGILAVEPGYSFVSLPCVNTSFTASGFLGALGDAAKSISYYDPATQSYVTYDRNLARFGIQEDFPIQPDVGYVVYSADGCSVSIDGIEAATRSIHMRPGYNLVGWSSPVNSDPVTAFVNPSNEAVQSVSAFNESSQQYVSYDAALASFGVPQPDFRISQGHAYFVFSRESCLLQYDDAIDRSITSTTNSLGLDWLQTRGKWIVDGDGNIVILRGINFQNYEYRDFPWSELDFQRVRNLGFNHVRFLIAWHNFEPTEGSYDDSYFDNVDKAISLAKRYNLYVILQMHNFCWSNHFTFGTPGGTGSGNPAWTCSQYPDTEEGLIQAIDNFYHNESLRISFTNAWRHIATRYASEPTVAGYDLFSEPPRETIGDNLDQLYGLYDDLVSAIRIVDSKHIIIYETWANPTLIRQIEGANIVYSNHLYYACDGYDGHLDVVDWYVRSAATVTDSCNIPYYVGEFGIYSDAKLAKQWSKDYLSTFDKYNIGWSYWAYGASDQPHCMVMFYSNWIPKPTYEYLVEYLAPSTG